MLAYMIQKWNEIIESPLRNSSKRGSERCQSVFEDRFHIMHSVSLSMFVKNPSNSSDSFQNDMHLMVVLLKTV